jgi:hypothetical protein
MDSKTQFISHKELAEWWASIANDPKFDSVLLYASNVAFEACPSAEQRDGVLRFREILLTLSNADSVLVDFAKPGLSHNLDVKRKTIKPNPKKDK